MWDFDKLFTDGNIIGIKNCYRNKVFATVYDKHLNSHWIESYKNDSLSKRLHVDVDEDVQGGYTTDFEIQYIIRLDEHGNVVEKLFDRDTDMLTPMPELETGMFIRVYDKSEDKTILAFVYKEGKRVIYQDGDFDNIADVIKGDYTKIVEVYPASVLSFNCCYRGAEIWRSSEYQAYLNSKSN